MISGYRSPLYMKALKDWHVQSFEATIRKHTSTEYIWMNYAPPVQLHDYSYLGNNAKEREQIKIKSTRWVTRFKSKPVLEQQALLSALQTMEQEN